MLPMSVTNYLRLFPIYIQSEQCRQRLQSENPVQPDLNLTRNRIRCLLHAGALVYCRRDHWDGDSFEYPFVRDTNGAKLRITFHIEQRESERE